MADNYKIMKLSDFARAIKDNRKVEHLILLGAGASASAGIKTARDCIWEWKKEIFLSNNPDLGGDINCCDEPGQQQIQKWLDRVGGYPKLDDPSEYTYYAEARFEDSEACRHYFKNEVAPAEPQTGYKILAHFIEYGLIKIVLTTNFDGLTEKALHDIGLTPQSIAIENSDRVHLPMRWDERFHIALHGDFKFGRLKNTSKELIKQEEDFVDALRIHLYNKNLIVMGYSGRDSSVMSMLERAYTQEKNGGGKLYWCNRSENPPKEVKQLLSSISARGRDAKLVVAEDFDDALEMLAKHCFRGVPEVLSKIGRIVELADVEGEEVIVESVEVDTMPSVDQEEAVDVDIAKLEASALDAAAQAALIGAWTEDDADQLGLNEVHGES